MLLLQLESLLIGDGFREMNQLKHEILSTKFETEDLAEKNFQASWTLISMDVDWLAFFVSNFVLKISCLYHPSFEEFGFEWIGRLEMSHADGKRVGGIGWRSFGEA